MVKPHLLSMIFIYYALGKAMYLHSGKHWDKHATLIFMYAPLMTYFLFHYWHSFNDRNITLCLFLYYFYLESNFYINVCKIIL